MAKWRPLVGDLLGGHAPHTTQLQRSLTTRHMQMIALGGAIGTGLFLGSGKMLSVSGTSIILTYVLIGFFFFFVMRAMGELLLSNRQYKSFVDFATAYLGPWAGFFLGWSYWLCWIMIAIADVIAIGGYIQFWAPNVPAWMPAFVAIGLLTLLNLVAVKLFGELEFWFAVIKVFAIVSFLLVGLYLLSIGFVAPNGVTASVSHLFAAEAVLPQGITGFLAGFQIAVFAFVGIELVGTAAAETEHPERSLPKAINTIPVRIAFFYVGTLVCMVMVMSWSEIETAISPFIYLFSFIGLPAAASVVALVVASAALSSANSGIFATSRMLYGLAVEQDAPQTFAQLSARKVPSRGLLFSMLCVIVGTAILFVIPDVITAFIIISAFSSILCLFTFGMIISAYLVYRRQAPELHAVSRYKMPGGRFMAWLTLAFLIFVALILCLDPNTRIAFLCTPIWFFGLWVAYQYRNRLNAERAWILEHGRRQDKASIEPKN